MDKEIFSSAEKAKNIQEYGSCSDEVCYAARRAEKIGAVPYKGFCAGLTKDVFKRAINQSKQINKMVAVYLNSGQIQGLFLVTPGYTDAKYITDGWWNDFVHNAYQNRLDKPIEEQKKEEEFDRFKNYEYASALYEKWDVTSTEGLYAAERLEKLGIKPFSGKPNGTDTDFDLFKKALSEATETNKKVGVYINTGTLKGLFVVSPNDSNNDDDIKSAFNHLVDNQKRLRWDKPILQQKVEEKMLSNSLINTKN